MPPHPSNLIGNYEQRRFPECREPTIDTLIWGSKRHHVPILIEVDVTTARALLRAAKLQTGQKISFTSWIVKCVAQAVSEYKSIHAIRHGRRRLIIFDDVDISIIVERAVGEADAGETLPMPYIIRQANEKTVAMIHAEIRAAQQQTITPGDVQISPTQANWMIKLFSRLPRFVRDLIFWQPLFRDPFQMKQLMGTVALTVLAAGGQVGMSWGIPIGIHPLVVAVGAIAQKPGVVDNQIVVREFVGITLLFDHDVIDGAPVARFTRRLQQLMANGFGLQANG